MHELYRWDNEHPLKKQAESVLEGQDGFQWKESNKYQEANGSGLAYGNR
jgi:hypothetical protein